MRSRQKASWRVLVSAEQTPGERLFHVVPEVCNPALIPITSAANSWYARRNAAALYSCGKKGGTT